MKKTSRMELTRKVRFYFEELNENLTRNINIMAEQVNSMLRSVDDEIIQKYLGRFNETHSKLFRLSTTVKEIASYSATIESWCLGNEIQ